jgi:hypothetical protein
MRRHFIVAFLIRGVSRIGFGEGTTSAATCDCLYADENKMAILRKLGLAITYSIASLYFFSILSPSIYCLRHGCRGPEGDAFMPAFFLTPVGTIATAFSLYNAIQQIRKRQPWSWVFWPVAVIFGIVLLGAIGFIALLIYHLAFHR